MTLNSTRDSKASARRDINAVNVYLSGVRNPVSKEICTGQSGAVPKCIGC